MKSVMGISLSAIVLLTVVFGSAAVNDHWHHIDLCSLLRASLSPLALLVTVDECNLDNNEQTDPDDGSVSYQVSKGVVQCTYNYNDDEVTARLEVDTTKWTCTPYDVQVPIYGPAPCILGWWIFCWKRGDAPVVGYRAVRKWDCDIPSIGVGAKVDINTTAVVSSSEDPIVYEASWSHFPHGYQLVEASGTVAIDGLNSETSCQASGYSITCGTEFCFNTQKFTLGC